MTIIIHSSNGLDYCKKELLEVLPDLKIQEGNDQMEMKQFAIVEDLDSIETLSKIIDINGYAYLWRETRNCKGNIDFYIDLTE